MLGKPTSVIRVDPPKRAPITVGGRIPVQHGSPSSFDATKSAGLGRIFRARSTSGSSRKALVEQRDRPVRDRPVGNPWDLVGELQVSDVPSERAVEPSRTTAWRRGFFAAVRAGRRPPSTGRALRSERDRRPPVQRSRGRRPHQPATSLARASGPLALTAATRVVEEDSVPCRASIAACLRAPRRSPPPPWTITMAARFFDGTSSRRGRGRPVCAASPAHEPSKTRPPEWSGPAFRPGRRRSRREAENAAMRTHESCRQRQRRFSAATIEPAAGKAQRAPPRRRRSGSRDEEKAREIGSPAPSSARP